jgi:hypothetical protein
VINILIEDKIHEKKIKYVFDYIFMVLGLKYRYVQYIQDLPDMNNTLESSDIEFQQDLKDINIIYVKGDFNNQCETVCNTIYIKESKKLFNDRYLNNIDYVVRRQGNIVNLMGDNELFIERKNNSIKTNIDIVSDIFFLLTRYEEVVNKEPYTNEKFNRFPSSASLMTKENVLDRPIVNEHIELLWSWIEEMKLGFERKSWWGDKDFAVCISHDVDFLLRYRTARNIIKSIGVAILGHKSIKQTIKVTKNYIQSKKDYKKDPFFTFDYIRDMEIKYGVKSSFYFMIGGTSKLDNFYNIYDEKVLNLINDLDCGGFEIGYHGSFNTFNDLSLMRKEKEILDNILENKKYGARQHCLRFKAPYTWRIQEKLGILYDTTLVFADKAGFRCGTCFPFKPYDVLKDRVIDIWEIPLIVMDATLMEKEYSCLTPEDSYEKIISLVKVVRKYGGVFSLLWHNSSLDKYNYKYDQWILQYERIMEYLGGEKALKDTGKVIIDYLNH